MSHVRNAPFFVKQILSLHRNLFSNSFKKKDVQGEETAVCISCHKNCDKYSPCTGDRAIDCTKCAVAGIYTDEKESQVRSVMVEQSV